jgi:hypothetical protein
MRANYFYVHAANGERKYFSDADTKKANEYAQRLADTTKQTIIRYDVDGGQSWFYASEITPDGYRIHAGS